VSFLFLNQRGFSWTSLGGDPLCAGEERGKKEKIEDQQGRRSQQGVKGFGVMLLPFPFSSGPFVL